MIVTIHQPDFAPWLGFFDRWAKSDLYIILDDVQFLRRGWHHRDRIKTAQGPQWLTVPVLKKGNYEQPINEVRIDDTVKWRDKHLKTLAQAYSKCAGFGTLFPRLEEIYGRGQKRLVQFNIELLELLGEMMAVDTPMVLASSQPSELMSTARLLDLTKRHGGTTYLTGTGSRNYLDETLFAEENIEVAWQEYVHPRYPQRHGEFETGMSVIDFLMNVPRREA